MRARLLLALVVVLAVSVAWLIRWGCDDAFISFHYARNLVRGDGLTWFGDHVEGYTNFAWVLWTAAGLGIGFDPLTWAWAGSLLAMVAVLVVTYRLALLRTSSVVAALCAVGLLATNFTFIAFGTSGLETMLQCALLTAATYEAERARRDRSSPRRLLALSVISAVALWTRLDSAVVLAVLGVVVLHALVRTRASWTSYAAVLAPGALLVGGWLAWKLSYYGELLPNTFHAKVAVSSTTLAASASFVASFLHSYLLWPLLLAAAIVAVVHRRFSSVLPASIVAAWLAYVIFVGGDFMEFRFFVPVMPTLFVLIAETVTLDAPPRWPSPRVRVVALLAALAAVSWRHAATFEMADNRFYDSVRVLGTYYGKVRDGDWSKIGRALERVLAGSGATIACNGAGAIPYYAELPTVDQLGLNDAWIARHGVRPPAEYARPGHQRFAPLEYLAEQRVTFVIGSPTLIPRGALTRGLMLPDFTQWLHSLLGPAPLPSGRMIVVAAPVDDRRALLMWYLTRSPFVSARIDAAGWEVMELRR